MRVYLDACCLSRLTDDQSQARIREEAEAIERVLAGVRRGTVERESAVLTVPSVVTGGVEQNILISPQHPQFGRILISQENPMVWDSRLFGRVQAYLSPPVAGESLVALARGVNPSRFPSGV
jgi:hypothetical protein